MLGLQNCEWRFPPGRYTITVRYFDLPDLMDRFYIHNGPLDDYDYWFTLVYPVLGYGYSIDTKSPFPSLDGPLWSHCCLRWMGSLALGTTLAFSAPDGLYLIYQTDDGSTMDWGFYTVYDSPGNFLVHVSAGRELEP